MPATPDPPLRLGPYKSPPVADPQRTNVLGAPGQYLGGPVLPRDAERATAGDWASLVNILPLLYPPAPTGVGAPGWVRVGMNMKNNQPVADRQTLTMAAKQFPNTGPYHPPLQVDPRTGPTGKPLDGPVSPEDRGQIRYQPPRNPWAEIMNLLYPLYPGDSLFNSQAIGDRPVTTMTNPLPAYNPLTMVKGQAAAQLRTLINHALAQRGLSPLINAPLPVGATQMGRM